MKQVICGWCNKPKNGTVTGICEHCGRFGKGIVKKTELKTIEPSNYKTRMTDKLADVIINLFTGKYEFEEICDTLAWGEKNGTIYFPLMKKHQPEYYYDNGSGTPILGFKLFRDLKNPNSKGLNAFDDYMRENNII